MADIGVYKDKFSESGQRIFQNALDESKKRDQNYITIGHILNALTVEESDLFNDTMRDLAIDPRTVTMLIEKRIENVRQHTGKGFRIAPETTDLFKKAMDRARGQGRRVIDASDIFYVMSSDEHSLLNDVLRNLGVPPEEVAQTSQTRIRNYEKNNFITDLNLYKDKFSDTGRCVLERAIDESQRRAQNYISVEHVLFALAKEEAVLFNNSIFDLPVPPYLVKLRIEQCVENGSKYTGKGFRIAPETTDLFKRSMERARARGHKVIDSTDILSVLSNDKGSLLTSILSDLGASSQQVAKQFGNQIWLREQNNLMPITEGQTYIENTKKERDKIILELTKKIQNNPSESELFNERGHAYNEIGEYEKAISDFAKAIELDPNNSVFHNNRGSIYINKGEYDKAIPDLTKAIELDSNYALAYNSRAVAFQNTGKCEEAILDYTKAIELNLNFAVAFANRGECYFGKGEYNKAIDDYTKALELEPNYSLAYAMRGLSYFKQKEYDKAISDCIKAVEINPGAIPFSIIGDAYSAKGNYVEAIQNYTKALELDPCCAVAYDNRGQAYSEIGDYDQAILDCTKFIELHSNIGWAYNRRGVNYYKKKQFDNAVQDFTKAIELNQDDPNPYENRANVYLDKEEYEKAILDYSKAIELNPNNDTSFNNRGFIYSVKGEYDKAILDFTKAVELNPESNEAKINLNETYKAKNEFSKKNQKSKTSDDLLEELDWLIGLDKVKKDVIELTNFIKVQKMREGIGLAVQPISRHLVFFGNPGTGKTTVARLIAQIYKSVGVVSKGHLVETDRSGLVAGYIGHTALKVKEVVGEAIGGVLFIDEAYSLAKDSTYNDFGHEAIETLLKLMEDFRDDLVVIVAGYTHKMKEFLKSNPGLRSRFNKYFEFEDYSPEQLVLIFETFCKKGGYHLDTDANKSLLQIFTVLHENRDDTFGNGRLARNLYEKSINNQANRIVSLENVNEEILSTIKEIDLPILEDVKKQL